MKKTVTANLNGRVFNIDEDAFQLLENYLKNLRIYFRNEDGYDEIVADFEARIEELLSERVRLGYNVISIEEVEKVIAKVGSPVDFDDKEENRTEQPKAEPADTKKKFYRDPSNKLLGGVCSGLAAYFSVNELALRILVVILALCTSVIPVLLLYLVAWLIVPEATTAEQKLEMQGKPITVENIGKTVSAGMDEVKKINEKHGCLGSLVDFIAACVKVALVGLGCLVGLPILFVIGIIIIVLFATIFGVGTGILGGLLPCTPDIFLSVAHPGIAILAVCLLLGIPLFALLYGIISWFFKLKPVNKSLKIAGLIVWILAWIALPFSGFKADWSKVNCSNNHWRFGYSSFYSNELVGNGVLAERTEELPNILSVELTGNLVAEDIQGAGTVFTCFCDNSPQPIHSTAKQRLSMLRIDCLIGTHCSPSNIPSA
jgi:phage shock protein PspC (stress-responsive transcriptional regulator)